MAGYCECANFKTKSLYLNVIPSEICCSDAKTILRFWKHLYERIAVRYGKDIAYLAPVYPYTYSIFIKLIDVSRVI